MEGLIRLPDSRGIMANHVGEFVIPGLNKVHFEKQGRKPICLPASSRVALEALGIKQINGVPLNENRRMVSIFKAHGLQDVETQGAFTDQLVDIIERFAPLRDNINIQKIFPIPNDWAAAMINNRVIQAVVNSSDFYERDFGDETHAITILGVDIPESSQINKDLAFYLYDPNVGRPLWHDSKYLFNCLEGSQYQLWRK